jgi:hypothetical protein
MTFAARLAAARMMGRGDRARAIHKATHPTPAPERHRVLRVYPHLAADYAALLPRARLWEDLHTYGWNRFLHHLADCDTPLDVFTPIKPCFRCGHLIPMDFAGVIGLSPEWVSDRRKPDHRCSFCARYLACSGCQQIVLRADLRGAIANQRYYRFCYRENTDTLTNLYCVRCYWPRVRIIRKIERSLRMQRIIKDFQETIRHG